MPVRTCMSVSYCMPVSTWSSPPYIEHDYLLFPRPYMTPIGLGLCSECHNNIPLEWNSLHNNNTPLEWNSFHNNNTPIEWNSVCVCVCEIRIPIKLRIEAIPMSTKYCIRLHKFR